VLLTVHVFAFPGIFKEVTGYQALLKQGIIDEFYQHKTNGMKIGSTLSSGDRPCSFIIRADSVADALQRTHCAMANLAVLDQSGLDIMRHDLYLKPSDI